jgi:hypothetical protein
MCNCDIIASRTNKGFGTIETILLIMVIGIIFIIILNGITTTAVVMNEVDDLDRVKELGATYLNLVNEKAGSDEFYETIDEGWHPPVPLTSEFTDAGNYMATIEIIEESQTSKQIIISYRKPGSLSFEEPFVVLSTVLNDPAPKS